MTFSADGSTIVVGPCLYGCVSTHAFNPYNPLPSNTSKLNELCSRYHRKGQLCGKCEDGFALPVYSYNLSCVNCEEDYASNWVKYLAASLLPLTLYLIMIVILRVRVTSGLMNAFVLVSQIICLPDLKHAVMLEKRDHIGVILSVYSLFGVWNLDFFRALYPSFCLHPKTTTLQILALDYVIAVYPLVLLVVTYLLVKLHDCDIKPIVWLWKPFHRCFVRFRRNWNIQTSLVDAFATFLLLSYMKFLSVSSDLLTPVQIFNIHGKTDKLYLYWDGTIEYFGSEHLPYAILALVVLILFTFLPLLLMCLYPCRWFQRCLNHCRLQSHFLHTFMDAFQGCYKDGTNGSHDCRWFAGLHLFTRILVMIIIVGVNQFQFYIPLTGCVLLIMLLLTALFQPYKIHIHNHVNIFFMSMIVFIIIFSMADIIARYTTVQFRGVSKVLLGMSFIIFPIYIGVIILYKLFGHQIFVQIVFQKLRKICINRNVEDFERTLPERMVNVEECVALLADPMQVSGFNDKLDVSTK